MSCTCSDAYPGTSMPTTGLHSRGLLVVPLNVTTDKLRRARNVKNWTEGVLVRQFNIVQPEVSVTVKRVTARLK